MKYEDYYDTLGVARSASQDDIKQAYRRLARRYHPDVSTESDAEEQFKALGEAYEVLKDPGKRRAYDQLGSNWQAGQDFSPPPGWEGRFHARGQGAGGAFGFSDFFETFFGSDGLRGGGPRTSVRINGGDQEVSLKITLSDAFRGASKTLNLSQANGRATATKQLNVTIPPGVTDGQQIRLSGQGKPGRGGAANGDLYLNLSIEPDRRFKLTGKDVHLDLPITPWEAALGATVEVPTLGGNVDLKIPPGSQSGKKMRLKGRGLGSRQPGDQYVVLKIVTPAADTPEAKAFYEKMANDFPINPRQGL